MLVLGKASLVFVLLTMASIESVKQERTTESVALHGQKMDYQMLSISKMIWR